MRFSPFWLKIRMPEIMVLKQNVLGVGIACEEGTVVVGIAGEVVAN